LPFYQNFFAGGFGSVRGFKQNTLGPRSTPSPFDPYTQSGDPFGGNVLLEGSAEIIFPLPFIKDNRSVRPSLFVDVGDVFSTNCQSYSQYCDSVDLSVLRYSAGISLTWITGMGPLSFALAKTFNTNFWDQEEVFQFELGKTF